METLTAFTGHMMTTKKKKTDYFLESPCYLMGKSRETQLLLPEMRRALCLRAVVTLKQRKEKQKKRNLWKSTGHSTHVDAGVVRPLLANLF